MSSGLVPIDEAVFRRLICEAGGFEGDEVSILFEELLDSHENGPASFLGGGADVDATGGVFNFSAGDEPHGRLGKRCVRDGGSGTGAGVGTASGIEAGSGATISFEVIVVDRDLSPSKSGTSLS